MFKRIHHYLILLCTIATLRGDFTSYFNDPLPLGDDFYYDSDFGLLYENDTFPWVYLAYMNTWSYCSGSGSEGDDFQIYNDNFGWSYFDAPTAWFYSYDESNWWYSFGIGQMDATQSCIYYNSEYQIIQPRIPQAPHSNETVVYNLGDFNDVDSTLIELIPIFGEDSIVVSITANYAIGGNISSLIIDTGSVYLFTETFGPAINCNTYQRYTYGLGAAYYVPTTVDEFFFGTPETTFFAPVDTPMNIGQGNLVLVESSIAGLAGNLIQENHENMTSVIQQLKPEHLSFSFAEGLENGGTMSFAPLTGQTEDPIAIPLVSPGTFGYGYTSIIQKIAFFEADATEPHTEIETTDNGVIFRSEGSETKVAERLISFFDTGTTVPALLVQGDISLLGGEVSNSLIAPPADAPAFAKLEVTFTDTTGATKTMTQDYTEIAQKVPSLVGITPASAIPEGLDSLVVVMGLNFIGHYNFQIDFSQPGVAETITFFETGK